MAGGGVGWVSMRMSRDGGGKGFLRGGNGRGWGLTAYCQLIPELPLRLPRLRGRQESLLRRVGGRGARGGSGQGRGDGELCGVHAGLALGAHGDDAAAVVVGRVRLGYARRAGRPNAAGAGHGRALHLLDVIGDLFRVHRLEDVGGGGREEGQDGEGAVLLVLLESPAEAGDGRRRGGQRGTRSTDRV